MRAVIAHGASFEAPCVLNYLSETLINTARTTTRFL